MQPDDPKKPAWWSRNWAGPVTGLLIAALGVILLLDSTGVLEARYLLRFWPAVLVVYGLLKLLQADMWSGRVWGFLLILAGALLQLSELNILHTNLWGIFWPLVLIGIGLTMLVGTFEARKQRPWKKWLPASYGPESHLNELAIFGGGERRFSGTDFEGGQLMAIFGGFKVDLTRAGMKGNETSIEVNAIFGGGEIVVPDNWNVVMRGLGIFGGYGDNTRHPKMDDPASVKTLVVRGVAMFGGVEVRN